MIFSVKALQTPSGVLNSVASRQKLNAPDGRDRFVAHGLLFTSEK
jgi:hypothetical protein